MDGELDATTLRLARYAQSFDLGLLDAGSLHECRRRLIDAAACAVAAFDEPFCQGMAAFAGRFAGPLMARLWGTSASSSIEMAAFANGTALRYLDYSDTYMSKNAGHPSDMIPALVATAEALGCTGEALMAALVVSYELYGGLCDAIALRDHGIDQATCAAVGTAAGVGRLLGLQGARMGQAISLALAPNLHLYNVRKGALSEWKGCAGPNGARNGVFAAMLAREGVSGPTGVIEGEGGLFAMVGAFDWQVGERATPRLVDTHLKLHPVCYHGQCAMDAVLALRPQVLLDEIEEIHVETYDAAFYMMGADPQRWAPTTRETADHSLPYTVAVALQEGRLSAAAYEPPRLTQPDTLRLAQKVKISRRADLTAEFPAKLPVRVTIRCRNGASVGASAQYPRGHAMNPLSDAELETKFRATYEPWRGAAAASAALELLWSTERLANVEGIVDALCAPVNPT